MGMSSTAATVQERKAALNRKTDKCSTAAYSFVRGSRANLTTSMCSTAATVYEETLGLSPKTSMSSTVAIGQALPNLKTGVSCIVAIADVKGRMQPNTAQTSIDKHLALLLLFKGKVEPT